MTITAIIAATPDMTIGNGGDLPWRLSTDLRRFKRLTMGCPMLMGRKTFDSIGRPLPGRTNIVLTHDSTWNTFGVQVVNTVESAIDELSKAKKGYVVGGAEIYRQFLPHCDEVMITRVWSQIAGDTRIDRFDLSSYQLVFVERIPQGPKDDVPTEFQIWQR